MSSGEGESVSVKRKRGRPLTIPTDPWSCPVMRWLVNHRKFVSFERDCEPRGCKREQFLECLLIHDILEEE